MKRILSVLSILTLIISIAVPVSAVSKPKAVHLKKPANTETGIQLKWTASKNATKYVVYRKTPKVKFKKIATVKTTSYIRIDAGIKMMAYSENSCENAVMPKSTNRMLFKSVSMMSQNSWYKWL